MPPPEVRLAFVMPIPSARAPAPAASPAPVEPPTIEIKPPFDVIEVPLTIEIAPPPLLRFELSTVSSWLPEDDTLPPIAKMTCRPACRSSVEAAPLLCDKACWIVRSEAAPVAVIVLAMPFKASVPALLMLSGLLT